jgi:hypothetical protein
MVAVPGFFDATFGRVLDLFMYVLLPGGWLG